MKSIDIKNYIENKLNILGQDYDISFNGDAGFYDHDWVKEKFGIPLTPFVLATNLLSKEEVAIDKYNFRYTIVALAFEHDRESIKDIFYQLREELGFAKIGGYNVKFTPNNVDFGADFSEGSGRGTRRFEALFEFEGTATKGLNGSDIIFTFDNISIPINTFKYEQAKGNFVNKGDDYLGSGNSSINKDLLVVETILTSNNQALTNFINKGQTVNISSDIILKVGGEDIVNGRYRFQNHSVVFDGESILAYLYFQYLQPVGTIKILDEEIPILSYAISTGIDSIPHNQPNSNIAGSIYLGKVRSYAFNIVEDEVYKDVIDRLYDDLIGDSEEEPLYEVQIVLNDKTYNKVFLLADVTKEKDEDNENMLTVKFIDGSGI